MRLLLQRVSRAQVSADGLRIASIGPGLVALAGFAVEDNRATLAAMLQRLPGYRMFADAQGKTNLSLLDTGGQLLLVPQFSLYADTAKGSRPGFAHAAPPQQARELFAALQELAMALPVECAFGSFGAHMQVELINDGPMTLLLESRN